jgi:hypothetical protein
VTRPGLVAAGSLVAVCALVALRRRSPRAGDARAGPASKGEQESRTATPIGIGQNMSDVHAARQTGPPRPAGHAAGTGAAAHGTGWAGWLIFASVIMIMLGAFQVIEGLVAVFQDDYYLVTSGHLVVHVDYTVWGWVHFGIGVAIVAAGLGLLSGQMWARILTIVLASLSAIVNLAFIAAYPVWGILIIAFDVIVIYAAAVHGNEMKAA